MIVVEPTVKKTYEPHIGCRTLRIGLFGCGVVGSGIVKILQAKRNEFRERYSTEISIEKICVRDIDKERDVLLDDDLFTTNRNELIYDDSLDVIVEVIGGYDDAKDIIIRSLENGKHVITANKYLLSHEIEELRSIAEQNNVGLVYSASVCGAVPVINALDEFRSYDEVTKIRGIVNGSTNFILTMMASEGVTFARALEEAQRRGFAEADPTFDISGADAAQKLSVLCYHAFGDHTHPKNIDVSGIERISLIDIHEAADNLEVIKLIAEAEVVLGKVHARVSLQRIPKTHLFSNTNDEYNALEITTTYAGTQILYGKGAGSFPTASAVINDIINVING
ncbi:MAG TPA: homoserine dehydrogenase [Candidatus Kapabacteria bacterium]